MYPYVSGMLVVYTRMYRMLSVSVCLWYVTRMYPYVSYVSRMYPYVSYVSRMYPYVSGMFLVCSPYVIRMLLVKYSCGFLVMVKRLIVVNVSWFPVVPNLDVPLISLNSFQLTFFSIP